MILELSGKDIDQQNVSPRVQVGKVGTFEHELYGKFSFDESDFDEIVKNFNENARKQTIEGKPVLPFDYSHNEGEKAAGWIQDVYKSQAENGTPGLFAKVKWTDGAAKQIRADEFRFTSPTIRRNYKDKETGKTYPAVLLGAALTNIPFLRDMEAIHLLDESKREAFQSLKMSESEPGANNTNEETMVSMEDFLTAFEGLSDDEKKRIAAAVMEKVGMKTEMEDPSKSEMTQEMSELSSKNIRLSDQLNSALAKLGKVEQQRSFDLLLSEGKVCEAQREAFLKSDMVEFAKNAVDVKLSEQGSGSDDSGKDALSKVHTLAEAKTKDGMDYGEAVSLVLSENPELAKKYEGGE